MSKYRVRKEYRPIPDKVMYTVEKKVWIFWWWVAFKPTQEIADDFIKMLKDEGL